MRTKITGLCIREDGIVVSLETVALPLDSLDFWKDKFQDYIDLYMLKQEKPMIEEPEPTIDDDNPLPPPEPPKIQGKKKGSIVKLNTSELL